MSLAPTYRGKVKMPYPFKYVLVFTNNVEGEAGTVEAFFVSKTLADKCCNELNAAWGEIYAVRKIFED